MPTGDTPAPDDAGLTEGCRRRDRGAQRQLYERYADRVYALALRMTGNRDEAFDLSQEIFLRIFDRIGEFRGDAALGTWIHQVAVSRVLNHLRHTRRERAAVDRMRLQVSSHARAADADVGLDVEAVLADLPDESRAILLLRYQQGLSYAEIARVLEIPAGTVASRLNTAREKLKTLLAGYGFA
jgi:RNA polymerase sigma-70 factor, ECF subfamily